MPIKARKKVVLCKIETAYGVDPTPVGATDALLVHNFSCTPAEIQYVERSPAMPFFGNQGQIKAGELMRMEFDIEAAGAGGVAVVPGFGAALRCCALSETITPTTGPVTYALISSGEESGTFYFYWDGLLHKMLGAIGTVDLKMGEGQVPMFHLALTGLYGGITDAGMASPTLTSFQKPLALNKANTTFTLHGFAGVLSSLTLTQGNEIAYKNRPNQEKVHFLGRSSKGSVTLELPLIAGKDFSTICRSEPPTLGALAIVHGTAAGNKFKVDAANVQLTNPKYSEADGVAMLAMDLNFLPGASGNDEWTFKTQ